MLPRGLLLLGLLLAAPWPSPVAVLAQPHPDGPSLALHSSNHAAGQRSRYLLWLPEAEQGAAISDLQLLLPERFNLVLAARQIRLCVINRAGTRHPAGESQCQARIPAEIQLKAGAGQDVVWIRPSQPLQGGQPVGVVIDLINPPEPGLLRIAALAGAGLIIQPGSRPLGHWSIRIDAPDHDD